MGKDIDMVISMDVKGTEGLDITLKYEKTDLKTVILVQKKILKAFEELLDAQDQALSA